MSQFSSIDELHVRSNRSGDKTRPGDRVEAPLLIRGSAGNIAMSNAAASSGGSISHGLPASPASYWIMPVISNVTMAVTPTNSAHLTMSMNFVNSTSHMHVNRSLNIIDYARIIKMVRVLGLMAIISYMIVILFTWIYANLTGYVYFSAGEPVLMIKYPEWLLGFIGIFVAIDCLRKELDAGIGPKNTLQ